MVGCALNAPEPKVTQLFASFAWIHVDSGRAFTGEVDTTGDSSPPVLRSMVNPTSARLQTHGAASGIELKAPSD